MIKTLVSNLAPCLLTSIILRKRKKNHRRKGMIVMVITQAAHTILRSVISSLRSTCPSASVPFTSSNLPRTWRCAKSLINGKYHTRRCVRCQLRLWVTQTWLCRLRTTFIRGPRLPLWSWATSLLSSRYHRTRLVPALMTTSKQSKMLMTTISNAMVLI